MSLYSEFYENTNTTGTTDDLSSGSSFEFLKAQVEEVGNSFGGVAWDGDADNEILFGTVWDDILYGYGG